jgi:hypothetical protein
LHAEGKLDLATLKVLLQKHRATLTASGESPSPGEPPPSPPEPHP